MFSALNRYLSRTCVEIQVIDKRLVSASFTAIAEVCNCGADLVQAVLQLIRDEVLDTVQTRKKEVALNFQIGQLVLSPNNTVQFKSLSVSEVASQSQAASGTMSLRLTEASLRNLEKGNTSSQRTLDDKSIAERSINYMQQRQSTASVGTRARRQAQGGSSQSKDIFATPGQGEKKSVLGKLEGATEDAPYFQRRLARTQARRGSSYADQMHRRKASDMLADYNDPQKQHAHLDQFLRDQILSQKSGRSNKKTTLSCSSSKKNNALIEMAAKNKYTAR